MTDVLEEQSDFTDRTMQTPPQQNRTMTLLEAFKRERNSNASHYEIGVASVNQVLDGQNFGSYYPISQ